MAEAFVLMLRPRMLIFPSEDTVFRHPTTFCLRRKLVSVLRALPGSGRRLRPSLILLCIEIGVPFLQVLRELEESPDNVSAV